MGVWAKVRSLQSFVQESRIGKALPAAPKAEPRTWLLLILLAGVVPPLLIGSQYIMGVLVLTMLFAIWASGWNIVAGYAGQFSFGHAAFVGIGAYASSLLFVTFSISPWIGMVVGGLLAALAALLIGFPAFRLRGPYFALTTIAFSEVVRLAISNTSIVGPFDFGGAVGVNLPLKPPDFLTMELPDKTAYYELALVMLVGVLALTRLLERRRAGLYWAAIRSDQDAASSLGVPVLRYKCLAAILSGFVLGMSGAVYAQYVGFVDPTRVLGIDLSIQIALMGLVGGRATVIGPAVGALVLYPAGEIARAQFGGTTSGAHLVLFGFVLILAIYFLPRGIVGANLRWFTKGRSRRGATTGTANATDG